jgi:hypothetical protein
MGPAYDSVSRVAKIMTETEWRMAEVIVDFGLMRIVRGGRSTCRVKVKRR